MLPPLVKELRGELNKFDYENFCLTPALSKGEGGRTRTVKEISVEELKKKIKGKENFQLIDVRENWEHEEKNIGGTIGL